MNDVSTRSEPDTLQLILGQAIRYTSDHILITNRQGRIEYVNHAFEAHTGYLQSEIMGQTPRLLKSGNHGVEFYERLWGTLLNGQTFRGVFINRKKDGTLFHEEKTISPVFDDGGEITHFVSVGRDITQKVKAEAQALELAIEQEKVRLLNEFVSLASHEFRTPLTTINTSTYILSQLNHSDLMKKYTLRIQEQVAHLARLLDNIVYAKQLNSMSISYAELIDIRSIVNEVLLSVVSAYPEHPIHWNIYVDDNLPMIWGNKENLARMFQEILEKIYRHSPQSKLQLTIVRQYTNVLIELAEECQQVNLKHIMEGLSTSDTRQSIHAHMDLGLTIARMIVELHGGHIALEEVPDSGAVVKILLPIKLKSSKSVR